MRSRLTDGNPEDPLMIYVGRLGAEKRLRDLRGVLKRYASVFLYAEYSCEQPPTSIVEACKHVLPQCGEILH